MVVVIPCGAEKLDATAPARDLYVGSMFRMALAAAEAEIAGTNGRILILSALHGLLELDTIVAPYDCKMGDERSIEADELAAQIEDEGLLTEADDVYALLPKAYMATLDAAMRMLDMRPPAEVYEGCGGIGEQRGVAACIKRTPAEHAARCAA